MKKTVLDQGKQRAGDSVRKDAGKLYEWRQELAHHVRSGANEHG